MSASATLIQHFYGDPRHDGTRRFYEGVRRGLTPRSRVLNLGAGPATGNPVRTLRGEVAWVAGADVDPCVLDNPELDEAVLIAGGRLPFPDAAFDLVLSDYVFEHVRAPAPFLAEAARVLRPGGTLVFRTPNLAHYVAAVSALTPHAAHARLANAVRRNPAGSQEPWRTCYRMNRVGQLRRLGQAAGFERLEVEMVETEPVYLRFFAPLFLLGVAYERLVNSSPLLAPLRANIFGRFTKPS